MSTQRPRLFLGGLTGRIYVATSYTDGKCGDFIANTKFDVTDQFKNIEAQRERARQECAPEYQQEHLGEAGQ